MMWLVVGCSRILPALVEPGTAIPCGILADRVDPNRPIADVGVLAAGPRRSVERRAEVRLWLEQQLNTSGFEVEARPFTISGVSGINLVAHGPDPGRILVGAHYDTVESTPGANDNASGVAVALEVARALGPDAAVTFVFFDAEEPHDASVGTDGRNFAFGAQAFADATTAEQWEVVFVLESVGFSCEDRDCQHLPTGVPASFPRDGRAIYWAVNRSERDWSTDIATFGLAARNHPGHAVTIPGRGRGVPQSRFSDHAAFWDLGVDAALLTDTALLRNPNYHRAGDRPGTLDAEMLADTARGVVAVVGASLERCSESGTP